MHTRLLVGGTPPTRHHPRAAKVHHQACSDDGDQSLGKNPRTDVEWIPEMPQDWRLVRVKDVMEFFNTVRVHLSAADRGVMTERTYDYYGASGVIDKVEGYLFDGTYILIAEDGANLLTRSKPLAFLATGKFWVNNHAHILKPRWGGDDTFFVHLLESQDFSLFVTGAAQSKLTMDNLGRFKLAVPRVTEQKEIAAFIHQKDTEFRPLFVQIETQIATLTAYRKSLIHEYVTGQRRITEPPSPGGYGGSGADVRRAGAGRSETGH
jgi:type I restriction enzyme S subunit